MTYFDEAASHSSQTPLLLNLVDRRGRRGSSHQYFTAVIRKRHVKLGTTLHSAGTAGREDRSQLKIFTKAQLVF